MGRGREGRARQLLWAVSELPASAGWGGDDFTPQKCLNQENNPTWDAAGRQAVEWGCGGWRWVSGPGAKIGGCLQVIVALGFPSLF